MNNNLDLVNVITFDYHVPFFENIARHPAPLYSPATAVSDPSVVNMTANYTVNYWIKAGLNASLINLGIPFFGRSWILNSTTTRPPAGATGPGNASLTAYAGPGFMAYYDICSKNLNSNWAATPDHGKNTGPFSY